MPRPAGKPACDGPRPAAAFTLVELLCVIVVIVIVAALALPRFGDHDMHLLRSAASLLSADLEYAQMQSIGNSIDACAVVFDDGGDQYHLARLSDTSVPLRDPGTGQPFVTRFGAGRASALGGVALDAVEVGADGLLGFTAFGAIDQGSDARIVLRAGDSTLAVRVDAATGMASID